MSLPVEQNHQQVAALQDSRLPPQAGHVPAPCMSLLGIRFNTLDVAQFTDLVGRAIAEGRRWVFGAQNLHGLYLYHHDAKIRQFHEIADYVHADGMALIFLARLFGLRARRAHRVTFVDWMGPLMASAAARNWRVFYLGSTPEVVQLGVSILRARFPGLCIEAAHGHFDARYGSQENCAVLEKIRLYEPHLLMVGMGMPRQEHWVAENLRDLPANAILTPGAAMDYIAGRVPTPPRWAGRLGLEWLFRFMAEPRRLWRRYLLEPWFILRLCARELYDRRRLQLKP